MNETNNILFTPLWHLRNNIWPQRSIHHPAKHPRRNILRLQSMTNYHHKMLHPRCVYGPKQLLRKKATGEKHTVCLYFSRDIHPIFPTFSKLIFKTVNGICVDDIKRKAVSVIYNMVIGKMLTYCCFEGWHFQLEIMSFSYRIIINCK